MHIRRRKTAKGDLRYTVIGPKGTNRTFLTQRDAKAYLNDMESRRRLGALYREQPVRFGEFADAWLDRLQVKAQSLAVYREQRKSLRALDTLLINQVTYPLVDDLISVKKKAHSKAAQDALKLLKRILRSAEDRGQAIDSTILRMPPPKHTPTRKPNFLTQEQLAELATWLPEHLRRAVLFAARTGLRVGEVVALEDSHLHLDRSPPTMFVPGTKTPASAAEVELSPKAASIAREQRLARPKGARHLFPAEDGGPLTKRQMQDAIRAARKLAGLEGVVFHDMRHTFAGLHVQSNTHPHVAGSLMRHADGGALFLKRYAKHRPEDESAALEAMDELWREEADESDELTG